MHKISRVLVDKVIAACEVSRGSLSVLRALAGKGVPEKVGGRWVGEGREALGRGDHPDTARCGGLGCEETIDLAAKGVRGLVAIGRAAPCPACGSRDWAAPGTDVALKMRLALVDTRAGNGLLELAGRAIGDTLSNSDPDNAANRLRAAIHVRETLDPERFGNKRTVKHEGSIGLRAEQSWAGALRQEQVDALSPAAVEQLREITAMQRLLDEQARLVVSADLEGKVHRVGLPIVALG